MRLPMSKVASMIRTISIARKESYPLIVGANLERDLLISIKDIHANRVAIISDVTVAALHGKTLLRLLKSSGVPNDLITFPSGEKNKNQTTVTKMQNVLFKKRYGRDSLIIALGGGVVGDVAGFVAATYLRGVPYLQLPTSLLAMVDSSIGGKVGVDTLYGKNTIGAFYQPHAVLMELNFLAKLPRVQVINGLLEAIKTFFTSDKSGLANAVRINLSQPLKTKTVLQKVIWQSIQVKSSIAERDEKEENERRVLNFGHTIGHALEFLSDYRLPHGFAVGYGMLAESKISELLGILPTKDFYFLKNYLAHFDVTSEPMEKFLSSAIIKSTKGDKKTEDGHPHYVLLEKIGKVYTKNGQYAHPVPDAVVKKAIQSLLLK